MALPKSFKQMPENFTPGDPLEAAAAETIEALKQAPGRWHQARRFRTIEAAESFGALLERLGNERVEVEFKGVIVYARARPTLAKADDKNWQPEPESFDVPPISGEVIDTSERRGRGRAS